MRVRSEAERTASREYQRELRKDPERYPAILSRQAKAKRERRAILSEVKLARGCMDCGYSEHAAALDFDHRPGEKKCFPIAMSVSRRWADVLAEVEKCDVVCANCHRVRTWVGR